MVLRSGVKWKSYNQLMMVLPHQVYIQVMAILLVLQRGDRATARWYFTVAKGEREAIK